MRDDKLAQPARNLPKWAMRRHRKPLRTRIVHYVQIGTDVVQRASPRVIVIGRDSPMLFTRKHEAQQIAARTGGDVERLTKYRQFKPITEWWA